MRTSKSSIAIVLTAAACMLLSSISASTLSADPPAKNDNVGVPAVKGNKAYPEGQLWKWRHFGSEAIESKERKQDPWITGLEGAKHPVILFDPADIDKIRERLKRGAGPRILEHLRRHVTADELRMALKAGRNVRWIREFSDGRQIVSAGLYAMLTGKTEVTKEAITKLIALSGRDIPKNRLPHGSLLLNLALGYDGLYNYMTPQQRQIVRVSLDKCAQSMYLYLPFVGAGDDAGGNWTGHCWSALGIAGFALQEENRYAADWIRQGRVANVLYMHNTFDPEGGDYEAFSRYFAMGIGKVITSAAADRRQGYELFTYRNNIFNRIVEFASYMLMPGNQNWAAFDDAFAKGVNFVGIFAEIAALTDDPLAQGIFEDVYGETRISSGNPLTLSVLYDPNIKAEKRQDSKRLSLAKAFRGLTGDHSGKWSSGHVFLRTGFDSDDDIYFASQCGDTGGWHGHADQTGFVLAAYGDVLVQDPAIIGSYGQPLCEWMKGPEAHSLVLIDGQATPDYTVGDKLNWPDRFFHGGNVDRFVHTETLDFVSMDFAEGLKLNPKVGESKRAKRYVIFLRHPDRKGYFVIVDDVIADDAPHRYEWLLQPDKKHKPVKEAPGQFAFNGRVDLKIRMIEPKDPAHKLATFKGYGVDYLRIRSQEDRTRGLFFTILYPKTMDMVMPQITEIRQGDVIGAKIGEDIVLFNKQRSGSIDAAGVKSDGELVAIRISGGAVKNAVVLRGNSLTVNGQKTAFEKP